jgi:hypothetical protein
LAWPRLKPRLVEKIGTNSRPGSRPESDAEKALGPADKSSTRQVTGHSARHCSRSLMPALVRPAAAARYWS